MAEHQPNAASLDNAFQQARTERFNTALTKALATKVPEAPAPGGEPTSPKAGKARASSGAPGNPPSSSPAPQPSTVDSTPGNGAPLESQTTLDPGDAEAPAELDEPQDGAAAAPEAAIDIAAIEALGKKRDLRGIEKQLGLKEGTLGASNHDYATLRRREDEHTAHVKAEDERIAGAEQALLAKFGPAHGLIELANKGDLRAYVNLIQATTGLPIAKFVQLWSQKIEQVSPRELELERELQRSRQPAPQQQEPAPAKPDAQAAITKANTYLTGELTGHVALKLQGGIDAVRERWIKSFDPVTKAPKLSPKAAADAVVAERRQQREQEAWLLSGKTPPAPPRTRTVRRQGSAEVTPERGELPTDPAARRAAAIELHAAKIRRSKAAEHTRNGGR